MLFPMELTIRIENNIPIAILQDRKVVIRNVEDALHLMADAGNIGARQIIIREEQLTPDFFDLSTGLAGEILQKFSNYQVRLAVVGDFSKYSSMSLHDFIYESNKAGQILFLESLELAKEKLSNQRRFNMNMDF